MEDVNITLPEPLKQFVDEQIASGRYGSTSEYMRELIRADERRMAEAKLEGLLLDGLRGEPATMTSDDWRAIEQDVAKRVQGARKGSA